MITKEVLKAEIDDIPDNCLEILYRIMKALKGTPEQRTPDNTAETRRRPFNGQSDWHKFVEETFGSLADAPITRADQGKFENRETLK